MVEFTGIGFSSYMAIDISEFICSKSAIASTDEIGEVSVLLIKTNSAYADQFHR
jgi:hypothetical protein